MTQKSDRIKTVIKKKNAFTLVELLIVMAILVIMATMMIGIFNAIGITNKGRDAQRKKDLNRIKIAFEEYYNDKGFFPDSSSVVELNNKNNCGSSIFSPYLNSWPCDPKGIPYVVLVETNKFRVITNLENKTDKDIPEGWYTNVNFNVSSTLNKDTVNYGVSSSNTLWYEIVRDYSMCDTSTCIDGKTCTHRSVDVGCNGDCFYQPRPGFGDMCTTGVCDVSCCGIGCVK